ncbi:MAG: DUF4351 domain-containing protein [Cyanobium usitatum Tobar12.5m-G36]|nr:DUF4351 domain-containing protein [Cyanobium usitatum Tobar12.5m-G36]
MPTGFSRWLRVFLLTPPITPFQHQHWKSANIDSTLDDVIAAILVKRFPSRSIPEACAMGSITSQIEALPLARLEALAEALLDFQGQHEIVECSLHSPELRITCTDFRRQIF